MMKKLLWMLLLSGCATSQLPQTGDAAAWQAFGVQQGELGRMKMTQAQMLKQDEQQLVDSQIYKAYSLGYEQGVQEYCQQSAYVLGISGKPYFGVCGDMNSDFQRYYDAGRNSTARRF
ncbi:DUF2799 domain-containing protein [Vibrio cholerae]|nr:DUF2799 domain-containing protein [Vibrio cholerae]